MIKVCRACALSMLKGMDMVTKNQIHPHLDVEWHGPEQPCEYHPDLKQGCIHLVNEASDKYIEKESRRRYPAGWAKIDEERRLNGID